MKKLLVSLCLLSGFAHASLSVTGGLTAVPNPPNGITSTATTSGTYTMTSASTGMQIFTGSSTETILLPVVSTIPIGTTYVFVNLSSGQINIDSSGSSLVQTVISGNTLTVTSIATTGTLNSVWRIQNYSGQSNSIANGIGSFGSTPNSSGASIVNDQLVLQPASGAAPGGVSTSNQTFSGAKTFNNTILGSGILWSINGGSGAFSFDQGNISSDGSGDETIGSITVNNGGAVYDGTGHQTIALNGPTLYDETGNAMIDPSNSVINYLGGALAFDLSGAGLYAPNGTFSIDLYGRGLYTETETQVLGFYSGLTFPAGVAGVAGDTTFGVGVPAIVKVVNGTGQTGSISPSNLYTPPGSGGTTNFLRATVFLETTTTASAGTISTTFTYTDSNGSQTNTSTPTLSLTTKNYVQTTFSFRANNTSTVQYSTTASGVSGSPIYTIIITLERLI